MTGMSSSNQSNPKRRQVYAGYQGKDNPSERDRIVHLLQIYRSTENFNAHYLPLWAEASPHQGMKGGLRIVQAREGVHARLMKEPRISVNGVRNSWEMLAKKRDFR